jgi:uncharacterized membrane protein
MNLKLRLQNKATLISIAGLIVSTIYQILGLLGIVPSISEDMVTQGIGILLNICLCSRYYYRSNNTGGKR